MPPQRNAAGAPDRSAENGMAERIAVIGLGYVGLPVALAFARKFPGTVGFDTDPRRVEALGAGHDWTGETSAAEFKNSPVHFTHHAEQLKDADIFIVCVPTPIDAQKRPELKALSAASETVAKTLKRGSIVCYESTVFPGLTEDFCGPILAQAAGHHDFKLG